MDTAITVPPLHVPIKGTVASPLPRAAIASARWAMNDKMNLRRGFLRLGISLVVLWLTFWTFAYVLQPSSSIKPGPASFAIRITAWNVMDPLVVAAIILGRSE